MAPRDKDDGLSQTFFRLLQSFLGIAINFLLVIGGMALAVWAFDHGYDEVGVAGFIVAGCAFIWLLVLQMVYGASLFGGDDPSSAPLIVLGLIVFGCGSAMAVFGLSLIGVLALAMGMLIFAAVFYFVGWDFFG